MIKFISRFNCRCRPSILSRNLKLESGAILFGSEAGRVLGTIQKNKNNNHQFPPLLTLLRILHFQTTLSHLPLYVVLRLPLPLTPSTSSHTFHPLSHLPPPLTPSTSSHTFHLLSHLPPHTFHLLSHLPPPSSDQFPLNERQKVT